MPRKLGFLSVAVLLVVTSCSTAPPRRTPAAFPQARLDAIATRYRAACNSPGAAIGVRTRHGTRHFAISGSFVPGISLGRDSQFLAGSVTKLFVATLAYRLIDAGTLSLDDPVARFLPDWPRGDRITIEMLLGHRSGMGSFANNFGAQLRELVLADLERVFSYDEVLDLVRAVPPVAEPGMTYHYSNANSIVLGAILQRVSHRSLGALMRADILGPLHLTRTIYGPEQLAMADAVTFHGLFDVAGTGQPVDIGTFPRAAALTVDPAAAGLFSTLPDLLTFTHALFGTDRLMSKRARASLASSVSTLDAKDLVLDDDFVIDGHGGVSPGAQTIVAFDDRSRTTVAVWCNRLDPGADELLASVLAVSETFKLAG